MPKYDRGHNIICVSYGDWDDPADVCIECEDCNEVLISAEDFDEEGSQIEMIKDGDSFEVNGKTYIAKGDAHMSGDASYSGYIVYTTDGECFFEEDFE